MQGVVCGYRFWGLESTTQGAGCGVWGLRVWGLGSRFWGPASHI